MFIDYLVDHHKVMKVETPGDIHIGLHTGACVTGLIGIKLPEIQLLRGHDEHGVPHGEHSTPGEYCCIRFYFAQILRNERTAYIPLGHVN